MSTVITDNVPDILAEIDEGAFIFADMDLQSLQYSGKLTQTQVTQVKSARASLASGDTTKTKQVLNKLLEKAG